MRQGRDVPRREFGSTPSTSAIPTDGATRMRRVRKRASTTRLARSRGQGGPRVGGLQNWMAPESLLISETVSLLSTLHVVSCGHMMWANRVPRTYGDRRVGVLA